MAAPEGFLYGDSTPSPLKSDFIAFLRDAFDFAVDVLRSDARMADAVHGVTLLAEETEREIAVAEELAADLTRALEGATHRAPTSLAARCATRIQHGALDLVRTEAEAAREAVIAERTRLAQTASKEYDACAKALETLVLRHTLPDAVGVTTVKLEGGSHYEALLQSHTPYGLEWTTELEITPSHALSRVLRIDRLVERLEIEAPEEGGWLHKEVRNRPQRLDRLHLTGLSVHPSETAVRLRSGDDGSGAGFDLLFRSEPARIELLRILEGGAAAEAPYNVVGDDVVKLQGLRDSLVAIANELGAQKKSLRHAALGGTPIGKLESPRALVEKVIANVAPIVHEIATRSLAPGELVIKRLLGDSRREEVFVSKKELEQKIEALSPDLRAMFDPLQLWEAVPKASLTRHASAAPPRAAPPASTLSGSRIQVISSPPPPSVVVSPEPELSPAPPGPLGPPGPPGPPAHVSESFPPTPGWPTRPPRG
jgi:hypothetical protein